MTDTIIKGSGNSRFFKGPPNFLTMFPDYQSFGQAVAAGEVPFDFGPLNPAGCEVIGDSLNKETLLKDATAALYGKGSNASPDDILAAIRPLIQTAQNTANSANTTANAAAKILKGSFVATMQNGTTINIPSGTRFVVIGEYDDGFSLIGMAVYPTRKWYRISGSGSSGSLSFENAVFSDNTLMLNTLNTGKTYYYTAIA